VAATDVKLSNSGRNKKQIIRQTLAKAYTVEQKDVSAIWQHSLHQLREMKA
jgi:hypothetical protein